MRPGPRRRRICRTRDCGARIFLFFGAVTGAPPVVESAISTHPLCLQASSAPKIEVSGSITPPDAPGCVAARLLPRRGAQSAPGVADLVVVHRGLIVRRPEAEVLDVEPADGGEQRIGRDHPVALGADQAGAGGGEVLLG